MMASVQSTYEVAGNQKKVQVSVTARPPPVYITTTRNSSAGKPAKTDVKKKSHDVNRTQNNNSNTTMRTRQPVNGNIMRRNSAQTRSTVNRNIPQYVRQPSVPTCRSKRNGSGSFRRESRGYDKDKMLSPDRQLKTDDEEFDEQKITFIDVSGDMDNTSGSQSLGKPTTICPQTILEQSHERLFNKVYEINLRASKITKISNLQKFTCLRVLDLSSNHIKTIENLDGNKELKEVKLYDNFITEINNLESTRELVTLQLQHNRIKRIGKGLSCLRKLAILRLDSNHISRIESRELAPCAHLTYLDISSNTIDNLSPLNCLSSLEELHATHNQLTTISDLSRCKKLQEVDVSYNKITDIAGLKGLPHLVILNVSHNLLNTSCLKAIGKLKSLQTLDISHNKVSDLDSIAWQFSSLEILDVTHNHIHKWTTMCCLSKCENLSELYVTGNPFNEENGEKQNYHSELQAVIPCLDILDGANVKRSIPRSAPVMRPMSATSVISARQVENQLKTVEQELAEFGANLAARFESARTTVGSLPSEAPCPRPESHLSIRSISSVAESRSSSRCSSRRKITDAQAFAATHTF